MNSLLKLALMVGCLCGALNQVQALLRGGTCTRWRSIQPIKSIGRVEVNRNGLVSENLRIEALMMADSIDVAMFGSDDGSSVVEVDGIKTVQYTAEETLAISEARFYIRKYMGNVLRALTRDFDRVYRSRFCKGEANYKPLSWKDIRAAATESSRKSSINRGMTRDGQYVKGSREEAKRLFLRNRLENTLAHYEVPAGAFFRAIDIHAPDWDLHTFTDYSPTVSVKQGDGSWLTLESGETGTSMESRDPESIQLIEDLRELKERLESKDKKHFTTAPDVIIHLSVLEKSMPRALGVCLKETEDVILKTIPILRKDEARKRAARDRALQDSPRTANPNKRRRGPKAKDLKKGGQEKATAAIASAETAAGAGAGAGAGAAGAGDVEGVGAGAPRRKKWTPGTQKVPKYMNQGVSSSEDNWV